MRNEKKYLDSIPRQFKEMTQEEADYMFFYTIAIWKKRYGIEACALFIKALCTMFNCNAYIIMNLLVDLQMYPEKYRHDVRDVAFLFYARDIPARTIVWMLHVKPAMALAWVKTRIRILPEIKRLFTDEQTSEIMKLLSSWNHLKEVPI